MKKVMIIFGTRPEAIKMCPLVKELKKRKNIETVVCVTGQHREMLQQVLDVFQVIPDFNLSIMKENQTLFDITSFILNKIKGILESTHPDIVLVHGDTTTSFVSALACFYLKIPVGHVEAGLRTYELYSPYPEEFNRQCIGILAKYHFAPTEFAKQNLINEGKKEESIYVTGNTVIDALKITVKEEHQHPLLTWVNDSKMILMTAHRKENIGGPMCEMFQAIKRIAEERKDIKIIYPMHKNPIIRKIARDIFAGCERIQLIEPLDVLDFHNFIARSYLILTDSGGIQEEATSLGVPVLVMRNTTERPEGILSGTLRLVGTKKERIYEETNLLLDNQNEYHAMCVASNPYGDGMACKRIVEILLKNL